MDTTLRNVCDAGEDGPAERIRPERSEMTEVRLGIDRACRADHQASLGDERGEFGERRTGGPPAHPSGPVPGGSVAMRNSADKGATIQRRSVSP